MKKLLIALCLLTLCLATSALAEAPIVINTPGEHTITLSGETILGLDGPAIDIHAPATKVTLILKNGTTTTLNGSFNYAGIANNGVDLVIRCEGADENHACTDTCGKLIVKGSNGGAGIGGNNGVHYYAGFNGSLTIMGGHITAKGGTGGAGIGGGSGSDFNGSLTIMGGHITAEGGVWSSGIGSGNGGAFTGKVSITGGVVTAIGDVWAAGIGSCDDDMNGSVTISGGVVTATGNYYGAGIGSGANIMNGTVTISGGTVTANGGEYGAGIGSSFNGNMNGTITISGGTVTATGGYSGAGIGSGNEDMSGSVTISGGTVTATGGRYAAAIGAGKNDNVTEEAVIEVNPTSGKIAVKAGADEGSAAALEGSPFTAKTSLKEALKDKQYAKFEFIAPPATPVPSPTPGVPATGDSMNFALLASLAAVSMLGVTVLLRKRNEA